MPRYRVTVEMDSDALTPAAFWDDEEEGFLAVHDMRTVGYSVQRVDPEAQNYVFGDIREEVPITVEISRGVGS